MVFCFTVFELTLSFCLLVITWEIIITFFPPFISLLITLSSESWWINFQTVNSFFYLILCFVCRNTIQTLNQIYVYHIRTEVPTKLTTWEHRSHSSLQDTTLDTKQDTSTEPCKDSPIITQGLTLLVQEKGKRNRKLTKGDDNYWTQNGE